MELNTLWYFLRIAERENITQAASELHMTQPHLTRQLRSLEKELGVPLFTREKKRLFITEEGIYVKQQAKQLFALLARTEEHVRAIHAGLNGKLYIGAVETLGPLYVPQWLHRFRQAFPQVTYQIWTANSRDVLERLDDGLVDVALVRGSFPEHSVYDAIPLLKEGWIALFSPQLGLPEAPAGTPLALTNLADRDLIVPAQRTREIQQLFLQKGLEARILCEFSPLLNGIVLAEEGLGVAILPASARASLQGHTVLTRPLAISETSQGCLVWRNDRKQTRVTQQFIEMLKQGV
ncbi:MAG: LysR family transcriptional regulator [Acidaminococcus sp.]|uniref:LysR family transcriptional regulator n=1 Tax=Acidaminococcus sp. TaxID=1872103 RepID=UPI003F16D5A0